MGQGPGFEQATGRPGEDGEQGREEDDQVAQVLQPDVEPPAADERGVVEHLKYRGPCLTIVLTLNSSMLLYVVYSRDSIILWPVL